MFNRVDVQIDSVEFESVVGGFLELVNVSRPDGVSVSQWYSYWERFIEVDIDTPDYKRGYKDGFDAATDGE